MRRLLALTLWLCLGVSPAFAGIAFIPGAAVVGVSSLGALGAGGPGVTCSPFTYAASPYFQSLDVSAFAASNATQANNTLASPACATTGATLLDSNDTGTPQNHATFKSVASATAAKAYTETVFLNRQTGTVNAQINMYTSSFAGQTNTLVDLGSCTIHGSAFANGNWSLPSSTATAQTYGSASWCKVTLTATRSSTDTAMPLQIFTLDSGFNVSYAGTASLEIGIWGVDVR